MSFYAAVVPTFTDIISPYLPFFGVVAGGILVGIFTRWNNKRGNVESKTPTVQQIWAKQVEQEDRFSTRLKEVSDAADTAKTAADQATRDRDTYRLAFVGLRDVFMAFVDRVQRGGPIELTIEEHRALELPVTNIEEDDLAGS